MSRAPAPDPISNAMVMRLVFQAAWAPAADRGSWMPHRDVNHVSGMIRRPAFQAAWVRAEARVEAFPVSAGALVPGDWAGSLRPPDRQAVHFNRRAPAH